MQQFTLDSHANWGTIQILRYNRVIFHDSPCFAGFLVSVWVVLPYCYHNPYSYSCLCSKICDILMTSQSCACFSLIGDCQLTVHLIKSICFSTSSERLCKLNNSGSLFRTCFAFSIFYYLLSICLNVILRLMMISPPVNCHMFFFNKYDWLDFIVSENLFKLMELKCILVCRMGVTLQTIIHSYCSCHWSLNRQGKLRTMCLCQRLGGKLPLLPIELPTSKAWMQP